MARAWALTAAFAALFSIACDRSPQAREANYLKRGKALLAANDPGRAQLEFLNAVQVMPRDAEPRYQLGLAYLGLHNERAAARAFKDAVDRDPKRSDAQLKLSQILAGSGNRSLLQDAMDRLQSIVSVAPENLEAVDTLAMAQWEAGRTEGAEKLLEGALERSPADLRSSLVLSRIKLSQNDAGGAEEVLRKAVASAPQSPQAALALGLFYTRTGEPEKAESAFRNALRLDPKYGPALVGIAAVEIAAKRMDQAEQALREAAATGDGSYGPIYATFLFRTGQRDRALVEYEKLAKAHPDDRAARLRLLTAYLEMNRHADALALLEAALKKNPKDLDALYQRSKLYLRAGKSAEALADLTQVRRLEPNLPRVHRALAAVYKAQRAPLLERQELNEVLRLDKANLGARLDLAQSYLSAGDAAQALRSLDTAPAAQKNDLRLIVARNEALLAMGKTQEARAILDLVLKQFRVPELLLQDAYLKAASKDYAGARAAAEEVLKQRPDEAMAALLIGDSYLAQKQPEKAEARLREIAASRPHSAPLQYVLGQFYVRAADFAAARRSFEASHAANPRYYQADLALADLDRREKHPEQARERLHKLIAADPVNVAAMMKLAIIEEETGRIAEATSVYRQILNVDSSNVTAMNNLAYHLAVQDPDEALKLAQRAAEAAPDSPDVQDTLGWVFYCKRVYRTAAEYLKLAYAKGPTPQRQFHLAMAYLREGDKSLGQQMLAAALQKDPNLMKTEQGW